MAKCRGHLGTYDVKIASVVAAACAPTLKKSGLSIVDCLACGAEGCAFSLSNGKIAKVFLRNSEAKLASYLLDQKSLPSALPKIDGIWRMPLSCFLDADVPKEQVQSLGSDWGREDVRFSEDYDFDEDGNPILYLLVREDLDNADNWLSYSEMSDIEQLGYLSQGIARGHKEPDDLREYITDQTKYLEDRYKRFEESDPDEALAVEKRLERFLKVAELFKWLLKRKIYLSDLHAANIGFRPSTEEVVIRDLGFTKIEDADGNVQIVVVPLEDEPEQLSFGF